VERKEEEKRKKKKTKDRRGTNHKQKTCLLATSGAEAEGSLEGVINPPLETSEGTNHKNTSTQTLGGQVSQSDFTSNLSNGLALVGSLFVRLSIRSRRGGGGGRGGEQLTFPSWETKESAG
jgi:hypothetical protein